MICEGVVLVECLVAFITCPKEKLNLDFSSLFDPKYFQSNLLVIGWIHCLTPIIIMKEKGAFHFIKLIS